MFPRRGLQLLLVLSTLMAGVAVVAASAPASAAAPAYLSIMISRTAGEETDASCAPYPGTTSLDALASGLSRRGVTKVVGTIVTDFADAAQSGRCAPWYDSSDVQRGFVHSANWADAAALQSKYHWAFISHSKSYANLATITDDATLHRETCGTLDTFAAHHLTGAGGMFAYPNNQHSAASVAKIETCFAYGRRYGNPLTNVKSTTSSAGHWMNTRSVNGGKCNNPALACYTMSVPGDRRYDTPAKLLTLVRPGAGVYSIVQFYRFVVGSRTGAGPTWDCTSTNANNHYTSGGELYCLNDLWTLVNSRSRTAVITDPASVANAWGRRLP